MYVPGNGQLCALLQSTVEALITTSETTQKSLQTTIINALNPICQATVGAPLSQVLAKTPGTKLQLKPTSLEKRSSEGGVDEERKVKA